MKNFKFIRGIILSTIVASSILLAENSNGIKQVATKNKKLSDKQIEQRFAKRFLNLKANVRIDIDKLDDKYLVYNEKYNVINNDLQDAPVNLFPDSGNGEIFQNENDDIYIDDEENIIYKQVELSHQPRLSIIIDDVSNAEEVEKIKEIPFKVTPSFFPPSNRSPNTPDLANEFDFYMVHLPLQAKSKFVRPFPNTLNIGDTQLKVSNAIIKIKEYFPNVSYINNHTGSAYTSNYVSMFKLYRALHNNNINFVDSRTIGSSKAKEIAEVFDTKFLERQVFLDNKQDKKYIKKQLLKAIKIAKIRGYAIAIGHPKIKTLEVLKNSSDLLDGIDLVYVKDLKNE